LTAARRLDAGSLGRLLHRERSLVEWADKLQERTALFPNATNLRQARAAREELEDVRRQVAELRAALQRQAVHGEAD
jgi:hypothetical protein